MLQNSNILKITEIFFNEPTKQHYLIEISRKSKIAHTSTKKYLNDLKNSGIINETVEKRGKRKFPYFLANINSNEYKNYKKLYNLLKIINSGLVEYLYDKIMPKSIVVFGSYSRGEDVESSDIDLFIESKKEDINLNKFEVILNRKIQIHFNEDFKNYSKELKNNILNGYILKGYLEAFK